MTEYQGLNFIGIVEHIQDVPSYHYCCLDTQIGAMAGHASVQGLGRIVACIFGNEFRQKITYEPPQGIDKNGTERGLCARRYYRLSVLEQDMFEKTVLNTLKGEKR